MRLEFKKSTSKKVVSRLKSRIRIRKRVSGTADRPRLAVFRSSKYIYAQLIDDVSGKTLASASSVKLGNNNRESSKKVGEEIAKVAVGQNITNVVFDRGGYVYHGKIKSLADGAREAGLKF